MADPPSLDLGARKGNSRFKSERPHQFKGGIMDKLFYLIKHRFLIWFCVTLHGEHEFATNGDISGCTRCLKKQYGPTTNASILDCFKQREASRNAKVNQR